MKLAKKWSEVEKMNMNKWDSLNQIILLNTRKKKEWKNISMKAQNTQRWPYWGNHSAGSSFCTNREKKLHERLTTHNETKLELSYM